MTDSKRNFLLLFFGRLSSRLGDSVFTIGVSWYILELTGSAIQMSLIIATMLITMIITGPLAGNVVDQLNKTKLLYLMDFIRGFIVLVTAITIYMSDNVVLIMVVIYAMAIISSLCTVVFNPASTAIMPLIMTKDELAKANSVMSLTGSVTNIVGLLLGGVIYTIVGPFGIMLIDGISYIISGISELFIKVDEPEPEKLDGEHPIKEQIDIFKEGLVYLKKHKGLIYIGLFATVLNFSLVPTFQVYQPYLVNIVLGKEILFLTVLNITTSVGMLAGGLYLSFSGVFDKEFDLMQLLRKFSVSLILLLFIIAIVVTAVVQTILPFGLFFGIYIVTAFVVGTLVAVINIPVETYIQQNTEPEVMGRVNSVIGTLSMISQPVALILGGILIEGFSIEVGYFFSAIILVLTTSLLLFRKELRNVSSATEKA